MPSFSLGAASNYAILYEGTGGHNFSYTNSFTNTTGSGFSQGGGIGNIGIGGTGKVSLSGPGGINGNLDLSAANTGQVTGSGVTISGTTNYSVSAVTSALSTVNALNTTLGALPGTNVAINGNTTINASSGIFSASGAGYTNVSVFTVTSFGNFNNGNAITINGDGTHSVVINFPASVGNINFHGDVILTGGLTPDNVIFNFLGNGALNLDDGNPSSNAIRGIFLDPNGTISTSKANILGRVFGGDASDFQWVQSQITSPNSIASPTLTTTPSPTTVTLGATTPPILTDTATLAGGNSPTGTITFTLFYNGGTTALDTEKVTVSGNGTYTTPTGFTLPTTGTVTGTYQWDASYSGDSGNNPVTFNNDPTERVTVSAATPTITTTPSPTTITLGPTTPSILTDTATFSGGFRPTGSLTFTLVAPGGGTVDTETVTVNGNATYTTPTGFTLPSTGTVTGTYQWNISYGGDGNNNAVTNNNAINERVTVSAASPTISTTPSPTTVTLGATAPPILTDTATLSGGFRPTGTITFTLFQNGGTTPVDTETVAVNGNGTYKTPTGFTLPSTGTATGTYQWDATYNGDPNNNSVSDINAANERVTVSSASPTITTSPNPTSVTLGPGPEILNDTATLASGFHPTGTITFTLFYNGGATPVDTETVTVNGNGTYTTPTGYTLPNIGTVTGTYQWDATYNGDPNNNPDSDTNALNERVTVSQARPTLTTTPTPTTVTLGSGPSPILTDTADLEGGFFPNGTITFTLFHGGSPTAVDTETVAVNGNGTYTTPTGYQLPATGAAVTGTYQWMASYSDRFGNNESVSDANNPNEQVTVSAASPAITTAPNPSTATIGTTLQDVADLTNGYVPKGSITFSLYAPGVNPSVGPATYTETVSGVNGNGAYHTTVGFAANASGTWHWVATYGGDPNNISVVSGPLLEPVTIAPEADLALAKAVNDPTPNVGETVTFTVSLSNLGPDPATGVQVTDLLPAGLTFVGATPSQGSYNSTTGVWTVGAVATTAMPTLQIQATVVSPSAETNTATITASDQLDPNTGNNTASATITPQQADLALTKIVNDATPNVGETVTFTVSLTNNGPDAATNVTVSDPLPAGLTLVSSTPSQGTYTGSVWTVGTVAASATPTLTIAALVVSPNAETNTATISHADQFDPDPGNNMAGATVTPQQADLAVGKQVSDPTPNVGEIITYTVTVSNNGPDAATGVTLQDVLPSGVSYQSSIASEGSYDPNTRTWTVGGVAVGVTQTLTITAKVVSANPESNTASISHSDQFDPNTANNSDMASIVPQQADLELNKMVNDPTPNVGETVTFTVTLTNNGPNSATGVQVSDPLPAGLTFVSATASQGSYSNVTGVWIVGTVTMAATPTLQIHAVVVSPNPATNTATISAADQFDPDPGNNTASTTVTPQQADLALTKMVNDPTPNVGETVTFTVALTNNGPNNATNVTVADALPAGLSLVSATPSQGTYAGGVWTVGTVTPSAAQTLTLTALVVSASAETNTATISHADQFDPNTANNSASATVTPQQADLALAKTVSNATPNVGDTVTFTVSLTNNGPSTATGVQVTDLLPAGLTLVLATPSQGSYNSVAGVWTVGTVGTAATPTLQIQATVVSPSAETNAATISHSDQFDPNTGNNSASATVTPQQADLALTKTVSNATPNVGDTVTFTVGLTNNGPDTATNVSVADALPAGLSLVSATPSQGTYTGGVWAVGTVSPSAAQTLTLTAMVVSAGAETNTATISHADQFDPNTSNNTSSATVTPQQADLVLTKTVSNPTPNVGDTVTFTVSLTNNGPDAATNVSVADALPAGLTLVSAMPSQGTYAGGVWAVGTVNPSAMPTLTLAALVVSPNAETNTATISHSDQFDPNTANNRASATVTPQQADLALTKSVSNATPNVGDTVTFTVSLTNKGPDAATNVSVADALPPGLTLVSATPSQGSYAGGVWAVGTVDPSAVPTLTLAALVVSPSAETNTATISHADQFDPNTGNNSASASVTPQQADLALTKAVNNPTPNVGDTVTFTISLTNKGPNTATNVSVADALPAGLTLVSATPSQGTYSGGVWAVGTVAPTANPTLTLAALVVSASAETNTATVSHADQFDPNTSNNTASATVTPQQADLALSKTVSDPTPNVGDTVTFTVSLTNQGPNTATNVRIADALPAGLTLVSATPSQGTYTGGVWTVGTVTLSAAPTLTLTARVVSPSAETNTATISHADQFDPNTGNNSAAATVTPQQADLAVGKRVSNPTPNVGTLITYTVTVTDNGPDAATGVTLQDVLPAGVRYQSSTASEGSFDPTTRTWTVGDVAVGATQTLTITAKVVSAKPQSNTASISHADQFDPDTSNNSDTASITPQQADLELTKMVNDPTPNVGDTVTFTVSLTNNGPNIATGVQVTDPLPAGLTFVSATPSQGSYVSSTGLWTVGTVAVAAAQTLQIQALVVSPNAETNTATITAADQFDPDPGNNQASTTVTPQQADLALTKMVNDPTPNVGETVTFTVALTNNGPDAATNVTVADALPAGLSLVSATPSQGTYTGGVWTAGTVDAGAVPTLTVTALVVSPSSETNTATISHSDQFDPNTGNNSASVTVTPQQADLALTKTVSNPTPNVGDTVTFTVGLTNNGPDAATNVSVADALPAGLTLVSAIPSQGTYTGGVWTVGTVSPTAAPALTLTALVVSASAETNTASISHADQFDPNTGNNRASATVTPQQADLALSKTVSNPTPNVGDTVTFTVSLTNNGPSAATNVSVADALPAGLSLVSAIPSQGSYAGGVWTVGTVAPTAVPTLTLTALVVSASAETNTATISHSDQFDPNTGNNSASATVTPQQADLALTKTVNNTTPNVGDTVTFTVSLTNNGPDAATNVSVADALPAGLTLVSATPSQGTYTGGVWTVGTVAPSAVPTLTLAALVVSPSAETNTATISHADQFDPNTGNNSASATVTPQQSDLALTKTISNATPNVGDTVTFTVSLTNKGPDAATNVRVADALPAGLTLVSATPSQGTYAGGVWTVGTVVPTAVPTLTLAALVVSPSAETNTAKISHSDQFDPNTGNNSASATVTPQQADLVVAKQVSDPTPNVGETITYTVTLTNDGPDTATGVQVTDLLPAGLTFVSSTPSQGTYVSSTGLWTVGTVAVAAAPTLQIQATVVSPSAETNTATISHADQFDPNTANNTASAGITPQQADLALTKTVNDPMPNVGDTVTFTVSLINHGPNAATNVSVADALPAGLTLLSATPSQGTYAGGVWTVGTVGLSAAPTLTFTARVVSPDPQTNTATINHADQFDPNTANNSASATVTSQQADLVVGKRVSDPTPNVGETITYTITVTNDGPDAATGVVLQDTLPPQVSERSSSATEGSYDPNTGIWTVGNVAVGATETLTITVLVTSANPQVNTASITHSDQFDPNTSNNSDSASIVPQQADLELTKIVSNPRPNVGDTITFTVSLINNGPSDATGVQVTDLLPAGLTFVSATASQGIYSNITGVWMVGSVATTVEPTLQIQVKVTGSSGETNTATISAADQFDPDPGNNSASATVTPQQADLALTKIVNDPTPNVGDTVTFTVTLTNQGPDPATNVTVADPLPAGLSLVSATPSQGTYTGGVWTVGTVSPSAAQTLTLTALVVSAGAETNTATITHSDQFDPDTGNNSGSATVTPQQSDLALTKTVSDPTPNVGDTVTFTVSLTNNGPDAATNVSVADALPAGLTLVNATPSQGTYAGGVWTVGTVASGATPTLTLAALVVSASAATNTATISHADQFDPDTGNNSGSATVTPQQADLALTKTVSNATPNVGDTVTFTVSLANNGPDAATNVTVADALPAGLSLVGSTPSQGTYAGGVWTVGTVASGATPTLTLTALVVSANAETNTATISHADQFDPNTANNSGSATVTPQQSDLALTKTVSDPTPNVGDTVTFTVTLTNNGPDAATGVQVTDLLPAGLAFVAATPSQGSYSNATGLWVVGTVAANAAPTLQIQATVSSPNAETNTATISHSDQFDPDTANNTAGVTVTPQQADLALTKTVNNPTPNVGDTVVFAVTLRNLGPDVATNVSVADSLPAGLTLVSATPSQGTYAGGVWAVGTVSPSAAQTLTLTALVVSASTETNTVTISHSDQFDPNTANNTASAPETPAEADLALSKRVSDATPNVGDTVSFTVTLTNNGPDAATGVQVTDLLPAGLTFVSATPSQGSYSSVTGLWTVGTVASSATPTLTLSALVVSPNAETNTATISHSDVFDPDTANNTASATVTPQQADLALTKTVNDSTPNVGDTITFTVTVSNHGPDDATNVSIADALPAGLTLVSATPSQGTYAGGVWAVGAVSPSAAQTLTLTARVVSPNAETNTATISHSDQFDPDTSNNSANATVTPQQADLALTKIVNNARPNVGDTVTFTVSLTNNGPDAATHVTVRDALPAGLTLVSAAPSLGTYAGGVWAVGTVSPQVTETLTLTARVASPNAATNTATISHADQFDPDTTNNRASATVTPPQADLILSKTVSQSQVFFGSYVTYTFVIRNAGPDTATGVMVTDPFPAGLVFVSAAAPSQGTYNSAQGVWSVGSLADGAFATLHVTVRVMTTGTIVNTARASSQEFDPDLSDNIASATVLGLNPATVISKRMFLASSF